MTPAIALYLSLTIVLAALAVAHARGIAVAWRQPGASVRERVLACVPPLTAVAAARAERPRLALVWGVLAITYIVLLVLARA